MRCICPAQAVRPRLAYPSDRIECTGGKGQASSLLQEVSATTQGHTVLSSDLAILSTAANQLFESTAAMSTKACNALFTALREVSSKALTHHQNPGNLRCVGSGRAQSCFARAVVSRLGTLRLLCLTCGSLYDGPALFCLREDAGNCLPRCLQCLHTHCLLVSFLPMQSASIVG